MYDIIVIGGGVSGMTAAVYAARAGAGVCVIEHNDRVGKKILSTGNGKCNLTNTKISPDCYNSSSGKDFYRIIRDFPPERLIGFMETLGVYTRSRGGYIYPASEQASAVLDGLRLELRRLGVRTELSARVTSCKRLGRGFEIKAGPLSFTASKLIIAAGSKCAPATGSDGSGYPLAESLGHGIVKVVPALVQLKCREGFFKELQGVRADAELTLTPDGAKPEAVERGELQLTAYGISGIPVFQLSGRTKRLIDAGLKPVIHIDFCPDSSLEETAGRLRSLLRRDGGIELGQALGGLFNKKLAGVLIKECGLRPSMPCGEAGEDVIASMAAAAKGLRVTPYDTNGFENAQTCCGGVSLDGIDLRTMESLITGGLYFAGEILDVDGRCGGYNLHWAFASGRLAGISAAGALK